MVDRLERCNANMIGAITEEYLSLQEKDGMVACLFFAVYAKHKVEEDSISNSDSVKVLPLRDYEKLKEILYDKGFMSGTILTGAALSILCDIIFFRKRIN